jgi:hypothetical protein
MNDANIRLALKHTVLLEHIQDSDTVVVDELGLRHGATRVDIAVINGLLHGYEIKSDRDTLERLLPQVRLYNSVLDRATLVVGSRHLDAARELIPTWWGIEMAEMQGNSLVFCRLRDPLPNPQIDPLSVAKLLWREEALQLLIEHNAVRGYLSKSRLAIYKRVVEIVGFDALRERVRLQIKKRKSLSVDVLPASGDG